MEFQYPWLLFSLLALPVVLLIWLLMMRWKKRAIERYGDKTIVSRLIADYSPTRNIFKFVMLISAAGFILFALANPRISSKIEKVKKKGVDIVICLDVSNSMRARDIKPDRLERSKMAISKLIDRLDEDQIGMVVFAGRAQTQLPLTPDYAGAKLYLNSISTDIIPTQGTAIGAAIDLAANSFNSKSKTKKVIILITDGENHEDDANAAAEKAAQQGIIIFTVGMGSPAGAPIPMADQGNSTEYKKDADGNTVVTKLNETMLKQIASIGKGTYTLANTNDAGLNGIYDKIGELQKTEYEALDFTDYENLYPYFLAMGILLLIIEVVIFERKSRLTRNIKLFSKPASEYVIKENKS
jgi:Ca-activated chloride channel homolog